MNGQRHRWWYLGLCSLLVAGAARAQTWCDVVFRDVAREAPVVILARPRSGEGTRLELELERVVKGRCERQRFAVAPAALGKRGLRDDDRVLLALDENFAPVLTLPSLGFCKPISVLAVRGGRLRAAERTNYDNGRRRITLEALLDDLAALSSEPTDP